MRLALIAKQKAGDQSITTDDRMAEVSNCIYIENDNRELDCTNLTPAEPSTRQLFENSKQKSPSIATKQPKIKRHREKETKSSYLSCEQVKIHIKVPRRLSAFSQRGVSAYLCEGQIGS